MEKTIASKKEKKLQFSYVVQVQYEHHTAQLKTIYNTTVPKNKELLPLMWLMFLPKVKRDQHATGADI